MTLVQAKNNHNNKEIIMNTTFTTSDLIVAAYLVSRGVKVDKIVKVGTRGEFHFINTDPALVAILVTEFDLGNATVEPQSFHNYVKHLSQAVRRM